MAILAALSNGVGGFGAPSCNGFSKDDKDSQTNLGGDFAQITKELVDNAVDACTPPSSFSAASSENESAAFKRVRVDISEASVARCQPISNGDLPGESPTISCFRVVVSDNGRGMEDVDKCVNAFSSRKIRREETNQNQGVEGSSDEEHYTSGRFGIGLTLSLLHAQRLLPGTGVSITSALKNSDVWTRNIYEPDVAQDRVVCKKKEKIPKLKGDSGTTISLYVPSGDDASRAWLRLAEYFARFQLCLGNHCNLEIKAPCFQPRPLFVNCSSAGKKSDDDEDEIWDGDAFEDDSKSPDKMHLSKNALKRAEKTAETERRVLLLRRAASQYKNRPDLKRQNVACSIQPIRRETRDQNRPLGTNGPTLEVGLVVFGDTGLEECDRREDSSNSNGRTSAELHLVRIVNGVPLLDTAEALACGIVRKASSNSIWNCFGLSVNQNECAGPSVTMNLSDSDQVAPFLSSATHAPFAGASQEEVGSDHENEDQCTKRKRAKQERRMLPAQLRLGEVLMVVQIRAKPSELPLPTLSKGRLPFNERYLLDALDNGITCCLKSLQASNPSLLLTAKQLKAFERDARYAPYAATAIGSVIRRSRERTLYGDIMRKVSGWDGEDATSLSSIVERRLRLVISDEYKESKKREEQEDRLRQRDEQRRQSRKEKVKTDDLLSDFESDGSRTSRHRKKSLYETLYGRNEQLGRDSDSSSSLSSSKDEHTIGSHNDVLLQSQQFRNHDLSSNGCRTSLGVDDDSSSSNTQMQRSRDDTSSNASRSSEGSYDDGLDASPAKSLQNRCDEHKENHASYESPQSQKPMNDGYESEPSVGVVLDSSDGREALQNILSNQRRSTDGFDSDSSLSSISQASEEETRQEHNIDGTNEGWWDSSVLGLRCVDK